MNPTATAPTPYGELIEPTTLRLQRLLPGPVERVWAHLTEGELRRQWLAAGPMALQAEGPFELVWRNDELTQPPGERPAGFGEEHRMSGRVLAVTPPRQLVITWGDSGEVAFDLAPSGSQVLLTLTHRRITERAMRLNISAGWHAHLAVLTARLGGAVSGPFWTMWSALKQDYDARLPA